MSGRADMLTLPDTQQTEVVVLPALIYSLNNSLAISRRLISEVPAPIS